jgi:RNA polymerase sigma-70 factor (ECF subfamily)
MTAANTHVRTTALRTTEGQLKELIEASLDGDAAAHSTLLRRIMPLLRAFFARRMNPWNPDVEDLVQEALVAVHTKRATFDRSRPLTPWLYSVARHKLVDHLRRSRDHSSVEALDEILASEGFERQSNAHIDIERLLGTLPAKQAAVIRQTKISGMSVAEVATLAGLSVSDVKVSVHRGLKALSRSVATATVPIGVARA